MISRSRERVLLVQISSIYRRLCQKAIVVAIAIVPETVVPSTQVEILSPSVALSTEIFQALALTDYPASFLSIRTILIRIGSKL